MTHLIVRSASDVSMRNVRFLRRGWTPIGSLGIVAGYGGLGKSTWWASEVGLLTRGLLDGVHMGVPKSALVLTAEDQWNSTVKPRLIAAGADLDRVLFFALPSELEDPTPGTVTIPNDFPLIEDTVTSNEVAWLIMDPLVSFLPGTTDSHNDASTRQVLDPLNQLASKLQIAVTGILHFNKAKTDDPYLKLSGSTAFFNAARSVHYFGQTKDASDDDPKRYLICVKSNLAPIPKALAYQVEQHLASPVRPGDEPANTSGLRFISEADINIGDFFSASSSGSARAECAELLKSLLTDHGGVVPAETYFDKAAIEIGASPSTMRRAAKTIGASSFKPGGFEQKTWWYRRGDIDEQTATRLAAGSAAPTVATRTPEQLETPATQELSPSHQPLDDTAQNGQNGDIASYQHHGDTVETQLRLGIQTSAGARVTRSRAIQQSSGVDAIRRKDDPTMIDGQKALSDV